MMAEARPRHQTALSQITIFVELPKFLGNWAGHQAGQDKKLFIRVIPNIHAVLVEL